MTSSATITLTDKSKLPQVLRTLMSEVSITEAELARKTGIPQPTLHRILSGATRSPRGSSLSPMAKFFSVSISQLIGDEPLPKERLPGTHNPHARGWTTLPILSGDLAIQWPKNKTDMKKQPWAEWTTTDHDVSANAFALRVTGDSMAPRFEDGTILIVEPSKEPRNRDFVIVHIKNQEQITFKQYLNDGSDKYLKPLNPEFKTLPFDKDHRIIGVVIQSRFDFYET